jgi:hypothetical protein
MAGLALGLGGIGFGPGGHGLLESDVAFSPQQIAGLGMWLDGADPATMTLAGSAIVAWRDKGGFGADWGQTSAAARPALQAADQINGISVPRFSGAQWLEMTGGFGLLRNVPGWTFFVVHQRNGTGNMSVLALSTANPNGLRLQHQNRNNASPPNYQLAHRCLDGEGFAARSNNDHRGAAAVAWAWRVDHVAQTARSWVGGIADASTTSGFTAPAMSDTDSAAGFVGQSLTGGDRMNGRIAEMLVWRRALPDAQVDQVNGYLAAKWGL